MSHNLREANLNSHQVSKPKSKPNPYRKLRWYKYCKFPYFCRSLPLINTDYNGFIFDNYNISGRHEDFDLFSSCLRWF